MFILLVVGRFEKIDFIFKRCEREQCYFTQLESRASNNIFCTTNVDHNNETLNHSLWFHSSDIEFTIYLCVNYTEYRNNFQKLHDTIEHS